MIAGTEVYRAYVATSGESLWWIDRGVVTDVMVNGEPLVAMNGGKVLTPLKDGWKRTMAAAKQEIHLTLVRRIGQMQAKADALADEILHDSLTTEEAAA